MLTSDDYIRNLKMFLELIQAEKKAIELAYQNQIDALEEVEKGIGRLILYYQTTDFFVITGKKPFREPIN